MVTAVLPNMSQAVIKDNANSGSHDTQQERGADSRVRVAENQHEDRATRTPSLSVSSVLTITPDRYQSGSAQTTETADTGSESVLDPVAASSQIAGYVGMFAGCGALLALVLFLPIPERFQRRGYPAESSLQYSYYIVAVVALFVSLWCLVGLRGLREEGIRPVSMFRLQRNDSNNKDGDAPKKHVWNNFLHAIILGFKRADIGVAYVGGFVARASSVGISLFVPLLVNALFRSSGLCGQGSEGDIGGLPDLKKKCSQAYILAAELTGVSQMVALLFAPIFGYASARLGRRHGPLMFASLAGIAGYILLATRFKVDIDHQKGSAEAFLSMCLIGISQIGAIVCSLGVLSGGVLKQDKHEISVSVPNDQERQNQEAEDTPLIAKAGSNSPKDLSGLKGSIAGTYSLYGGAGILLLTKLGGLLFDRLSFGAPFFIMAIFNGILLLVCILVASRSMLKS